MQAMTRGRDGIALAHAWALKLMGVARRLSLVAAVLAIAALVAGTAGTSYAKSKKKSVNTPTADRLQDTVVVSNYGAVFGGSIETFLAGAGHSAPPKFWIRGPNTLLGASSGAAGDAVSSVDAHIAVAVPIDFFDLSGCGPFGQPAAAPAYGTGFVEIFSPAANGNSSAENMICSPNFAFGAPNTTGVFYPQGVAFESPYDGVNPGRDIVAVANMFPVVVGPDPGIAACAPAPGNIEPTKGHPGVCGGGPVGPGSSLGTITLYDRSTLTPGLDNVAPMGGGFTVDAVNPFSLAPYTQNATIGGCLSLLAGPAGLTFDESGYLFVVNNAGFDAFDLGCAPRYITVYAPGASGDSFPVSLIGYAGATAGDVNQPVAAAVDESDNLFVTDSADNAIKIFYPFTNYDTDTNAFDGELLGVIQGSHTKLKSPMGIALDADDDALYVVSARANSLEMFTNFPTTGGDIPPTLIISGPASKMNLPAGVALPAFTPVPTCTDAAKGARGDVACE
jgi:hypothetical protein